MKITLMILICLGSFCLGLFCKKPFDELKHRITQKLKRPFKNGETVYYIMTSFHNGIEQAHYRVYHSRIVDQAFGKFLLENGFVYYEWDLFRKERTAQKLARKWNKANE